MLITPEQILTTKPDGVTAQSRLGRLTLAHMTADVLMSAEVFTEILTDERGQNVALCELVVALASGLSGAWTATTDTDEMIAFVRSQLALLEQSEVDEDVE